MMKKILSSSSHGRCCCCLPHWGRTRALIFLHHHHPMTDDLCQLCRTRSQFTWFLLGSSLRCSSLVRRSVSRLLLEKKYTVNGPVEERRKVFFWPVYCVTIHDSSSLWTSSTQEEKREEKWATRDFQPWEVWKKELEHQRLRRIFTTNFNPSRLLLLLCVRNEARRSSTRREMKGGSREGEEKLKKNSHKTFEVGMRMKSNIHTQLISLFNAALCANSNSYT